MCVGSANRSRGCIGRVVDLEGAWLVSINRKVHLALRPPRNISASPIRSYCANAAVRSIINSWFALKTPPSSLAVSAVGCCAEADAAMSASNSPCSSASHPHCDPRHERNSTGKRGNGTRRAKRLRNTAGVLLVRKMSEAEVVVYWSTR